MTKMTKEDMKPLLLLAAIIAAAVLIFLAGAFFGSLVTCSECEKKAVPSAPAKQEGKASPRISSAGWEPVPPESPVRCVEKTCRQ